MSIVNDPTTLPVKTAVSRQSSSQSVYTHDRDSLTIVESKMLIHEIKQLMCRQVGGWEITDQVWTMGSAKVFVAGAGAGAGAGTAASTDRLAVLTTNLEGVGEDKVILRNISGNQRCKGPQISSGDPEQIIFEIGNNRRQ